MACDKVRSWNEDTDLVFRLQCQVDELTALVSSGGAYTIISFTSNVPQAEKGTVVNDVNLSWALPEDPDSQNINQGIGPITPVTARSYPATGLGLTTTTTFTLTAIKGAFSPQKSTTVTFLNRRYWGSSANPNLGTAPDTLAGLTTAGLNNELSNSKAQTRIIDCSGGKYFYFAWPVSLGTGTFKVNSLPFTGLVVNTANVTNGAGFTEPYYFYRSNYIQYGSAINVEVT